MAANLQDRATVSHTQDKENETSRVSNINRLLQQQQAVVQKLEDKLNVTEKIVSSLVSRDAQILAENTREMRGRDPVRNNIDDLLMC